MKRMIRGMIGLSLAAGLSACDNDPSLDFGGAPTAVQANPSVMFINQGATKEVLVRLVNDRNQSIPAQFEISNVGSGISVALDPDYRPNNIDGYLVVPEIKEQHRYFVTANSPVGTTFTISNGSLSTQVRVNVIPTEIPITFGALSGGFVDVTSADFTFDLHTEFAFGSLIVTPTAVSADGHTATIIAPPGQAGVKPVISGARASYMPTVALSAAEGTAGLTTPAGTFGSATAAGAPTIVVPEDGITFSDVGEWTGADTFGAGGPIIWYKLDVATDRHLDITVNWGNVGPDVDAYLCADAACNEVVAQVFTAGKPEHFTADVTAGVYYLVLANWSNLGPVGSATVAIHP